MVKVDGAVCFTAAPEMIRWGADGTLLTNDRCECGQKAQLGSGQGLSGPGTQRPLTAEPRCDLARRDEWAEMDKKRFP